MHTPPVVDIERARALPERLQRLFTVTGEGIHGSREMPEDAPPNGVEWDSLDHLLFITLTVAINDQRDAHALWIAARHTVEDPEVRYLFETPLPSTPRGTRRWSPTSSATGSRRSPARTPASGSRSRARSRRSGAAIRGPYSPILADCGMSGPVVLERLPADVHQERGRNVADSLYMCGPKIGLLWLRMPRDNVRIELSGLEAVSILVDVHLARASSASGVVRGTFQTAHASDGLGPATAKPT